MVWARTKLMIWDYVFEPVRQIKITYAGKEPGALYKKINELKPVVARSGQFEALEEAKQFIESEIGAKIDIIDASKSETKKAKTAAPHKPGILLE